MLQTFLNDFQKEPATWVAIAGGLIGFAFGLYQYWRAQLWQRAQFVAEQMSAFFADEKVKTALRLIDYSRIRLTASGKIPSAGEQSSVFDDALCTRALQLHQMFDDEAERFSTQEMVARDAFDELLTWLEKFDHFLVTRLVRRKDLAPYLRYWLFVMADPRSRWKSHEFYEAMSKFITGYGYSGAQHLLRQVGGIRPITIVPARPR